MKPKIGSIWKFENEKMTWCVIGESMGKLMLSGPGPCRSIRFETEKFLRNNAMEMKPVEQDIEEHIFPKKYIPMLGKLSDVGLAELISFEAGIPMTRQKVRYWRKRKKIGKFSLIQNAEKIKSIKNYIEANPNFTMDSLKKDLGIYMINGKSLTWDLLIKLVENISEKTKKKSATIRNVPSILQNPSENITAKIATFKIKHGYGGSVGKRCKCDMCKLTRTIYQRYYNEFGNPMKIKCCEAFALLYLSKYKSMSSTEFYIFLDSIVTPDMFRNPEIA